MSDDFGLPVEESEEHLTRMVAKSRLLAAEQEVERLREAQQYWEGLWRQASVGVLDLQAEVERLRGVNDDLERIADLRDNENERLRDRVLILEARLRIAEQAEDKLQALKEAIERIRDDAINRLTEDSPMLLIDVRLLDAALSSLTKEEA